MDFSKDQIKLLDEPLIKEHVKSRDGIGDQKLSYLALSATRQNMKNRHIKPVIR